MDAVADATPRLLRANLARRSKPGDMTSKNGVSYTYGGVHPRAVTGEGCTLFTGDDGDSAEA